jgi:hypothetical protein
MALPNLFTLGLPAIEPGLGHLIVILDLKMRKLSPDAGKVEGVGARRKTSVRVVDVVTNLFPVCHRLLREV